MKDTGDVRRGRGGQGAIAQLWGFVKANGKWWLVPLLAVLALVGALIIVGSTGAAPFIYTLF